MFTKSLIVLGFAVAVSAFCGALVGIGRQYMSMDATLIVHAIGAPIGASMLSSLYFRNFYFTNPLATAAIFVATALALDVFVVALIIEKSFDMFKSVFGGVDTASADLRGDLSGRDVRSDIQDRSCGGGLDKCLPAPLKSAWSQSDLHSQSSASSWHRRMTHAFSIWSLIR